MPLLPKPTDLLDLRILCVITFFAGLPVLNSNAQSVKVGYHIVAGESHSTTITTEEGTSGGTTAEDVGFGQIEKGTFSLTAGSAHTLRISSTSGFSTSYSPESFTGLSEEQKQQVGGIASFFLGSATETVTVDKNIELESANQYGNDNLQAVDFITRESGNVDIDGTSLSVSSISTNTAAELTINKYADDLAVDITVGNSTQSISVETDSKRLMIDEDNDNESDFDGYQSDGSSVSKTASFDFTNGATSIEIDLDLYTSPAATTNQPKFVFRSLNNRSHGDINMAFRELDDDGGTDVLYATVGENTSSYTWNVESSDADTQGIAFYDQDSDPDKDEIKAFLNQSSSGTTTSKNPNIWINDLWMGNHTTDYGSEASELRFADENNNTAPGPGWTHNDMNEEFKLAFTPDFAGYWAVRNRVRQDRHKWILHAEVQGCLGTEVQEVTFGSHGSSATCSDNNTLDAICNGSKVGISTGEAFNSGGADKNMDDDYNEFKFPCPQWKQGGRGTVDVTAQSTYTYNFDNSIEKSITVSLGSGLTIGGEMGWYLESVELDVKQVNTANVVTGSNNTSSEVTDFAGLIQVELTSPNNTTDTLVIESSGKSTVVAAGEFLTEAFLNEPVDGNWKVKLTRLQDNELFLVQDIQLNWVRHEDGECSIQPTNPTRLFPFDVNEDDADAYLEDCSNAGEEVLLAHSSSASETSLTLDVPSPAADWDELEVQQLSSDVVALSDPRADEALLAFRLSVFDGAESEPLTRNNGLSLSDGANGESSCDGLVLAHSFLGVDACTDAAKLRRTNVYVPHRGGGGLWDVWLSDSFMSSLGLAPDGAKVLFLDDDDFASGAVANLWSTGDLDLTTENQSSAWLVLPAAPSCMSCTLEQLGTCIPMWSKRVTCLGTPKSAYRGAAHPQVTLWTGPSAAFRGVTCTM